MNVDFKYWSRYFWIIMTFAIVLYKNFVEHCERSTTAVSQAPDFPLWQCNTLQSMYTKICRKSNAYDYKNYFYRMIFQMLIWNLLGEAIIAKYLHKLTIFKSHYIY